MKNTLRALSFLVGLLPAMAAAQQFPTVPDHTVIGRAGTGSSSGPSQAIPWSTLLANISGTQSANKVYAGPASGSAQLPAFRLLVGADLPNPSASSLGGIESITCSTGSWLNSVSIGGVPNCAGGAALTSSNDTNVTITLGGTPSTALFNAASITMGWTGTLAVARGGTGSGTTNGARQGLNIYGDQGTGYGDVAQVLANTDRFAYTTAALTAARIWTLPAANVTGAPYLVKIADMAGGVTSTNTLTISRAGSDTINGGTSVVITATRGGYECYSDGTSKWNCIPTANVNTVTTSLGSDTAISNSVYTDGPSVAQGTVGTWLATGTVTLLDTTGANQISCKLWDQTTVFASGRTSTTTANVSYTMSLSGVLASPAGNIRISCTSNATGATSTFKFNASGNSKDSTLTVVRLL